MCLCGLGGRRDEGSWRDDARWGGGTTPAGARWRTLGDSDDLNRDVMKVAGVTTPGGAEGRRPQERVGDARSQCRVTVTATTSRVHARLGH